MAPPSIDLRRLPPDPSVDPKARYRQKDPHYLRRLLESVDPGPRVSVDADRDGYVDARWLESLGDIRKGFSLQNELYRRGHISLVRSPESPTVPLSAPVFDYLSAERKRDGGIRLFAYFDDPSELAAFKAQTGRPDLPYETVPAERVERRRSMVRDVVDPDSDLPNGFARHVDDANRPPAGSSKTGRYFRVEVTGVLDLPRSVTGQIDRTGLERSNCANLVAIASGLEEKVGFIDGGESLAPRLRDPERFRPATDAERGDIVVWYKQRDSELVFIHTFIDLGNGWALTKNGSAEENPVRLQRIETLRYLYGQEANRARIEVAYWAPKWVVNPDHYGWQRDGGGEPPPYRPMVEERYRILPAISP